MAEMTTILDTTDETCTLDHLPTKTCTLDHLPTKTCTLDHLPTKQLNDNMESVVLIINYITNASLDNAVMPVVLKQAIVSNW